MEETSKNILKYKWIPFQFLASAALVLSIYYFIVIARMKGEPGLGGLAPIVYFGFAVIVFFLDIFFQQVWNRNRKAVYIIEAILTIALLIWIISLGGI